MQLSNEELGKYLERVRKQKGYSTYDVNKLTDISQSYISLIEKGKRKASAVILKTLAPIYNLDYLDLYEKAGYIDLINDETNQTSKIDRFGNVVIPIPLLGEVKAGYDYMAQENWQGTVDIKEELARTGTFFALKIKGDSMLSVLWENDIVAVKKQDFAENNDIAVVLINGDEATVKKINILDNGIMLIPFNSDYGPMFFTKEDIETKPVKIIGVVKEIIERKFY